MSVTDHRAAPEPGTTLDARPGGQLWRYSTRLQPRGVLLGVSALAAAWAFGSRVNVTSEQTMLIALITVGLSTVMADPAGAVTAASPTPRAVRHLRAAGFAAAFVLLSWLTVRLGAAVVDQETPWPTGWELLEFATLAASQIALGAASATRRNDASLGPGLLLALCWYALTGAPRMHEWFFEVGDHGWTWASLLGGFIALAALASIDPARRRPTPGRDRAHDGDRTMTEEFP